MSKKFILYLAAIIFIVSSLNINAQKSTEDIVLGQKITLHSEVLNEDRIVDIYLPEGYGMTQSKFPVLYLLDGENHFVHGAGVAYFLARFGLIPQIIVVAIENVDRTRDFTPTKVEARPTSGGAEKFTEFIKDELMTYMDENYRTEDYNILFGHSLGGMYTFYSMLEYPQMFKAYIAASPHLLYDDDYVVNLYKDKFASADMKSTFIYFSIGDEPDYMPSINQMQEILSSNESDEFIWDYKKYENDTHMTTTHKSIYDGLESLYIDWPLSADMAEASMSEIMDHYAGISARYGYDVKIPETTLNILGYRALNQNEYDLAIERFKKNVELYPGSANVYDSLGEAYERMEKKEAALENYKKAYETAQNTGHPLTQTFKQNYERLKN